MNVTRAGPNSSYSKGCIIWFSFPICHSPLSLNNVISSQFLVCSKCFTTGPLCSCLLCSSTLHRSGCGPSFKYLLREVACSIVSTTLSPFPNNASVFLPFLALTQRFPYFISFCLSSSPQPKFNKFSGSLLSH